MKFKYLLRDFLKIFSLFPEEKLFKFVTLDFFCLSQ